MNSPGSLKTLVLRLNFVLAFGLFLALLAHAYVGLFSRYWYDDFCTAAVVRDQGFLDAQRFWYLNWSGRFSFHALVSTSELVGPRAVSFLPAVALLLWVIATSWATYQVLSAVRWPFPKITSFVIGLTVVFVTTQSTPDLAQSLYWQTGMLTYLVPLILLTTYAGVFAVVLRKWPHKRRLWILAIAGAMLTFFAGGLSETYSLLQIAVLTILLLACLKWFGRPRSRAGLWFVTTGLCGGILALSIVAFAPGNRHRLNYLAPTPLSYSMLNSSAEYALYFVERHARRSQGVALLSFVVPAWLVFSSRALKPENSGTRLVGELGSVAAVKLIALSAFVTFLLLTVCFLPGYVVSSEGLPLRAQIVPQFVLVTFMMWSGLLLALALFNGLEISQRLSAGSVSVISLVAVALMLAVAVHDAHETFARGRTASTYATRWDELDREIRYARQNGATEFILPRVNASDWNLGFGRIDMQPGINPAAGPNRCLAQYYGLDSVRVE